MDGRYAGLDDGMLVKHFGKRSAKLKNQYLNRFVFVDNDLPPRLKTYVWFSKVLTQQLITHAFWPGEWKVLEVR